MPQARIQELECRVEQVLTSAPRSDQGRQHQRQRPASIFQKRTEHIQKDTRNSLRSVMYFGNEGSHAVW